MCVGLLLLGFFLILIFVQLQIWGREKNSIKIQDIDESGGSTLKIILGGEKS